MPDPQPPPTAAPATAPATATATTTGTATAVPAAAELGPGVQVGTFSPGRYAGAIQRTTQARHARQVLREDMTSSFVMHLEAGGAASVCRGWRYQSFNDGPDVHTAEHLREQLGYRGRWESRDGWIHVTLRLDDTGCPRVGQYTQLVPDHANELHLRCIPLVRGPAALDAAGPVLACQVPHPGEPVFGEDAPHAVQGVLPGNWILLGGGNGLRIRVQSSSAGAGGGPGEPSVRVEPSADEVQPNTWERSF